MPDTASVIPAANVLETLIAPLSPDAFFAEYYERSFYHSKAINPVVGDILSLDRIDEIISDSELPPTSISMAKGGQPVPNEDYTFANGVVDRGAVLDQFRNGATIVLPQLHFGDGKLYSLCLALERRLGARVQTNIYLTPPGEHGFGVHYDDHDVFVLQVAGAKDWEIYGARENLPFRGEGFRKGVDEVGELREQFVLETGQCLYVPRGTAHRALTRGDQPSLHITVGVLVQTWADFMLETVAEASLRIPELRRSLPHDFYFAPEKREEHRAEFTRLIHALADTADFNAIMQTFSGNFISEQGPRTRGALLALSTPIGDDEVLRLRENILYTFEAKGEQQQLHIGGSSVGISDALYAQLAKRLASGSLRKADLAGDDRDEVNDVVGTLVAYGLLVRG